MNKYEPYSAFDIDILMCEPWEVSDQPYKLHAAYALDCLCDVLLADKEDEDDEDISRDAIWGCKASRRAIDQLAKDMAVDFNDAADNRKPIRIAGKPYSIRKVCAYDHSRIDKIFNFPTDGDNYIITKDGIMNLGGVMTEALKQYENTQEQSRQNRTYLRQIIMLAEADDDGWDKLTDMEVLLYCWAKFYNEKQSENWKQFRMEYKDYFYVTERDAKNCFIPKAAYAERPLGMYTFSYQKVMEWNNTNKQSSVAKDISSEEADNYWYDTALKTTFVPLY